MRKNCFLLFICLAFFSTHCALDFKGHLSGGDAQDARPDQAEDQRDIFIDWAPDLVEDNGIDIPIDEPPDTYPDTPEDPGLDMPVDPEIDTAADPDPEPDPDIITDPDMDVFIDPYIDVHPEPVIDLSMDRMEHIEIELVCIDEDDDGVCASADCNDHDPNNWISCSTCRDGDGDHYYVECDDYLTILGPDCDDTSDDRFPGNPEVCDGIDNDCNGAVDDGLTCVRATQGSTTHHLTPISTSACLDDFCWYDYDSCRCIPTPLGIRLVNRTVIAMVQSSCDGISLVVLHDAMSGGGGYIDTTITNSPAGAYNDSTLLVDDYWGEDPCGYSAPSFECSWGWGSSWGGDGMCAGYYTGDCCITFQFSGITDMDGISLYDGSTGTYIRLSYSPNLMLCIQNLP